jgi:hypothetical protein
MIISLEELRKINKKIDEQYIKIMPVAKRAVKKKLGKATNDSNECIQIAEDFVGEAVASLTAGFKAKPIEEEPKYYGTMFDKPKKRKTQEELDIRQSELFDGYKKEKNFFARYIHKAVIYQCDTRLSRWSVDKDSSGNELKDDRSHEKPKEPAVRARHYMPDNYEDEWLANKSSILQGEISKNDIVKVDLQKAFEEKNITDEEQQLIFHLIDGLSYVEMAETFGGIDEQYRYKLKVALAKLGLKPKDLTSKAMNKKKP